MAKPRVFVSSTYYDLKNIRNDIEKFISDQGYEPILNEDGKVPYSREEKLEEACYREVQRCDILISIIGGRRGTNSVDTSYSISNKELKIALEHGKQVYIFIEHAVFNEYRTYLQNKDNESVKYVAVDDNRIYKFIEELHALPLNNVMHSFSTASDIINFLKEQWAGLFQRLLESSMRQQEVNTINNLNNIAKTLQQMVTYLKERSDNNDATIKDILLSMHPAFQQLRKLLEIPYRVIFSSYNELKSLLEAFSFQEKEGLDSFELEAVWVRNIDDFLTVITISHDIFDKNGNLKIYSLEEWNEEWIKENKKKSEKLFDDDDIPF